VHGLPANPTTVSKFIPPGDVAGSIRQYFQRPVWPRALRRRLPIARNVSRDEAVNSGADAIDATPNSPQVFLNTLNLPVFEITRKIKRVFKGYRSWQIYITLGAMPTRTEILR
jgi:hypothetical protein